MHIFFVSLPFDLENSGDYDYCTVSVEALNKLGGIEALYIRGESILNYNTQLVQDISIIAAKNKGGDGFYKSLRAFYKSEARVVLAEAAVQHIINLKQEGDKNIVNLQLRPPETGFLFSPNDLQKLQEAGFKICVTCHEYKLNYSRRWLQDITHPYFEVADLVLFFNRKDMDNASKHANHTAFLENVLQDLSSIPNEQQQKQLIHGFSVQDHSTLSFLDQELPVLFVSDAKFTGLRCEMLLGEIAYKKGAPVRYGVNGLKTQAKPPFTLEWGVRTDVDIPHGKDDYSVSGIIINPERSDEIDRMIHVGQRGNFFFKHDPYNLSSKSRLIRVPPTTADIESYDPESFAAKPANIAIFGLIREGKGYEQALQIIEYVHSNYTEELRDTRLVIVGKAASYSLLSDIISKKFGISTDDIITSERLETIFELGQDAGGIIDEVVYDVLQWKKQEISKALIKANCYSEGIEDTILANAAVGLGLYNNVRHSNSDNPLEALIRKIASNIPESLPIDIFLDVPRDELPIIFAHTKYSVKYDEKGWANNASGLINLLCYGTVLYTNWGMCTDSEVTNTDGDYYGSMVLPKGKYCLRVGESLSPKEEIIEKRTNNFKDPKEKKALPIESKKRMITVEDIVRDILMREERLEEEKDNEYDEALLSLGNNLSTFNAAGNLLNQEFHPDLIAKSMLDFFGEI